MGHFSAKACAASNLLSLLLGLWICQHRPEVSVILGPAGSLAVREKPDAEDVEAQATPEERRDDKPKSAGPEKAFRAPPQPQTRPPQPLEPAPVPAPMLALKKRGVTRRCLDENCERVRARCTKDVFNSRAYRCPSDDWLKSMVLVDPNPDKILINIGCNKGTDAIAWLELFDQQRRFSLKDWARSVPRGPCKLDTNFSAPPAFASSKGPVAVCVEAAPRNAKLLKEKQRKFRYDSGSLQVIHAAASDAAKPGETITFPDAPAGEERAGLDHNEHWRMVKVPKETVDSLAKRLGLPRVDALLVDTEGADPAVLEGSKQTLKTVRYLLFEVHRDLKGSHWSRRTLLSVAEMLDSMGFDCYWASVTGAVHSVTQCYEPRMETIAWSNVVCAKRGDVWWKVLEQRDPNAKL